MNKKIEDFYKSATKKKAIIEDEKESNVKAKKIPKTETIKNTNHIDAITDMVAKVTDSSFPEMNDFLNGLETWAEHLKDFTNSAQMKSIYNFVKKEYSTKTVFPPKDLIFNAFKVTEWDNLKIVIIGQDPYPNLGEAMGLSFSVPKNIKVPKSLQNIYKCLEKDSNVKNFKTPKHGDLTKWAEQGVFLLNATLTVVHKEANSHQKTSGWSNFTDHVIKKISKDKENIVFLLWGNFAINKKKFIDTKKHYVIENIHPSPLAASKGDFTASKQFSEANEYLEKVAKKPIDWSL